MKKLEKKPNNTEKSQTLKIDQIGNLRRILSYVGPYWQYKVVIGLIILTEIINVLTPDIIGDSIDLIGSLAAGQGAGTSRGWASTLLVPLSNWLADITLIGPRVNASTSFLLQYFIHCNKHRFTQLRGSLRYSLGYAKVEF